MADKTYHSLVSRSRRRSYTLWGPGCGFRPKTRCCALLSTLEEAFHASFAVFPDDDGVFIQQGSTGHTAKVEQEGTESFAAIRQQGEDNTVPRYPKAAPVTPPASFKAAAATPPASTRADATIQLSSTRQIDRFPRLNERPWCICIARLEFVRAGFSVETAAGQSFPANIFSIL